MPWFCLVLAGLSEIIWAYGLKMTHGFTHLWWSVLTVVFMAVSFFLFARAIRTIPVGTAYAVFTGIGTAGAALMGILFLGEPAHWLTVASFVVLTGGIVGLKLAGDGEPDRGGEVRE